MPSNSPALGKEEILPVTIGSHEKESFGYSFIVASIVLPILLGTATIVFGRCSKGPTVLCESPPFGESRQDAFACFAFANFIGEAVSNIIKYALNERERNRSRSRIALMEEALINENDNQIPLITRQARQTEQPPATFPKLIVRLTTPYVIGMADNLFFTIFAVIPVVEKYASSLSTRLENSHIINMAVSTYDLQSLNKLLNKLFIAVLYSNAFCQLSGLAYPEKLLVLVGLVGYVYFRQFVSIQSGCLIRQQLKIQQELAKLKSSIEILQHAIPESRIDNLIDNIDKLIQPLKARDPFISIQEIEKIFQEVDALFTTVTPEKETEAVKLIREKVNTIMCKPDTSSSTPSSYAHRFFKSHLPHQPKTLTNSLNTGMALIIINLFLPPLIAIFTDNTQVAAIVNAFFLSLATFMPPNGLTDWENKLWGLNTIVRGKDEQAKCIHQFISFFVVNLPKEQAFVGASEGVGMSLGNTQIALVCELINSALTSLRSYLTLPSTIYLSCTAEKSSDKESDNATRHFNRLM